MELRICPIKGLYQLLRETDAANCAAVISSSADVDAERLTGISYVFLQYDDVDTEIPGRSFSESDAARILGFLQKLGPEIDTLWCCCDAGQSRSPAVAAAICRRWGLDDSHIWKDPRYRPNMLVFDLLTKAFGLPVSDEEKDFLLYTNRKPFRDAIRNQ